MKSRNFYFGLVGVLLFAVTAVYGQNNSSFPVNLLLNSEFEFFSFEPHRTGRADSNSSGSVPGWNIQKYNDIRVSRISALHPTQQPKFFVKNAVIIKPGKKLSQFFTLPEGHLLHNDVVSFMVDGYQKTPNALKVTLQSMKIDAMPGTWQPSKFGMISTKTYTNISRGELVPVNPVVKSSNKVNFTQVKIENYLIVGKKGNEKLAKNDEINTVGIEVILENTSKSDIVIYRPTLVKGKVATAAVASLREVPTLYRHIPKFIQKLWRKQPVHILVMGSSIDRGSANPPLYTYDENPASKNFKKPLMGCYRGFSAAKLGYPEMEDHFAQGRHFYSVYGRLKRYLMAQFDMPADHILLNFMAADGSCIAEAHVGFNEYAKLQLKPNPELNGHKEGKTWQELYPALFQRPDGILPDLVIFGSGANEKTDTPNEVALFEAAIRIFQRMNSDVEFLFCQFQNRGGYTPNPHDLAALSLSYQIPFINFGRHFADLMPYANSFALVPPDGHPQASGHYLWFKQMEKAFMAAVPLAGINQTLLPNLMHGNTHHWEGEGYFYKSVAPKHFIVDDAAFNCWATGKIVIDPKTKTNKHFPMYINGKMHRTVYRPCPFYLRNSFYRYGYFPQGGRYIVEMNDDNPFNFIKVFAKVPRNRKYIPSDSKLWVGSKGAITKFASKYNGIFGDKYFTLQPGQRVKVIAQGTEFAPAYIDDPNGGVLVVKVGNQKSVEFATNVPYKFVNGKTAFMENRQSAGQVPYGTYEITLSAKNKPVKVLGLYTYDKRLRQK